MMDARQAFNAGLKLAGIDNPGHKVVIFGKEYEIKVGSYIKPENWHIGSKLIKGDDFSQFRIPLNSNGPIKDLACDVKFTGRTLRWAGYHYRIRVQITIPGDGEPDTVMGGWYFVENM